MMLYTCAHTYTHYTQVLTHMHTVLHSVLTHMHTHVHKPGVQRRPSEKLGHLA